MDNKEPDFAFQKKIFISEFKYGDLSFIIDNIRLLLYFMQEINKKNKVISEFFRLDFRPMSQDEELTNPRGYFVMDFKWGSKKEINNGFQQNDIL